jgi:hypothetical protein
LPDVKGGSRVQWPLRLVLSLVLIAELFFVIMLSAEGAVENFWMILNSLGLIVFCVLTWRGIPWSRWFLILLLVWRVTGIVVSAASHFGPDDHRLGGSLVLLTFYIAVGLLVASPLGRARKQTAA